MYPYTLEASSLAYLSGLSSHKSNLDASYESAKAYLAQRRAAKDAERARLEKEQEGRRRDELRRVAPGWNGEMNSIISSSSVQDQPSENATD